MIDSPTKESALLARKLVEIHFKQQLRVREAESRLQKVQMDLFAAQGEMASGLMVEFNVNRDLVGCIIGKKGQRIKSIETQTGCTSINVDGDSGRIRVTGPDSNAVQRAREQLELVEHSFNLNQAQVDWYSKDYKNGSLGTFVARLCIIMSFYCYYYVLLLLLLCSSFVIVIVVSYDM